MKNLYIKAQTAHDNDNEELAEKLYLQILNSQPNHFDSLRWLGDIYVMAEKYTKAIDLLERARQIDDTDADMMNDLALCYYEQDIPTPAVECYLRAIELSPNHNCAHSNLGKALYEMYLHDDKSKAQTLAKKWKQDFPNSSDASFMGSAIAGLNPAEQNTDFVKTTFDDFAESFDEKLADLDYKAPQLLSAILHNHCTQLGTVLDAGCGTGLAAPFIKNSSDTITGVDLSGEMIKLANKTKLYSALHHQDLIIYMQSNKNIFNTIIASDVLCYFGDLTAVIAGFKCLLKEDGLLAFSLEKTTDNSGFILNASGRYKHTEKSVIDVLQKTCFNLLQIQTEVLRTEHGNDVVGLVVLAKNII